MMTLDMIDRLKRTVDDRWESPVADLVAAAWGYAPGTAKWWRSSASHVFVIPDPDGKRYLRFIPGDHAGADAFPAVAALTARLAERGARVARPVPSATGDLVPTIATPLGHMQAMMVEAAPGSAWDAEALDAPGARAWGTALARLHLALADAPEPLPGPFAAVAPDRFADDPELRSCAAALKAATRDLSRDPARFGVVHGDFELDNIAWQDGDPTVFDFDEAHRSWYVADIAFALRDLTDDTGHPAAEHADRVAAFIEGYREIRTLERDELDSLPLFAGLHALAALNDISNAVAEESASPDTSAPEAPGSEGQWRNELREDLLAFAADHRRLALTVAGRYRNLEDLEGDHWGDPPAGATTLMSKVYRLRRVPLRSLTIEHLRMLLGQRVGVDHLMPLAMERLRANPLAEGDMSPGALLRSALHAIEASSPFARELLALAIAADDPDGLIRDELAVFDGEAP